MKNLLFILGVVTVQFCLASKQDEGPLLISESSSLLMEEEKKVKEDNVNNFIMPTYREEVNDNHYILSRQNDVAFYFFNSGQGNCILVKQGRKALLIDAGGSNVTVFKTVFEQTLGNAFIECVIITHPHDDHYSFLKEMGKNCFSEDVFLAIGGPQKWKESDGEKTLENIIKSFEINFKEKYCISDNDGNLKLSSLENKLNQLFNGIEFNFLKFGSELLDATNLNSYSLVFRMKYKNSTILFTGDSTGDALDRFLTKQNENKVVQENRQILKSINVFIMPHHGADTEGSWRWTNHIIKSSYSNLVAMITCVDPSISNYGHARNWIRDLIFPPYARKAEGPHSIIYSVKTGPGGGSGAYSQYVKETKNRLYETGLFDYGIVLIFSETGNIHILNSANDTYLTLLPKSNSNGF